MEIKEIIANIREKEGLTQAQLAKKLYVTRQAVSKWERGEGTPDLEILKKISDTFQFSMDYLTGKTTERKGVVCQSCGMLIKDETQKGTEKKGEKTARQLLISLRLFLFCVDIWNLNRSNIWRICFSWKSLNLLTRTVRRHNFM